MYDYVILPIEIIAALCGIIYFKKYRETPLWPWLILLIMAPTAEIVGIWYSNNVTYNNHVVFNIHSIVSTMILLKIIHDHIQNNLKRKVIVGIAILLLFTFFTNGLFDSIVTGFLMFYFSLRTFLIIIALALFLIDILKSDRVIAFKENLPLIVFTGYIIFSVIYLPIFYAYHYIVPLDTGGDLIYNILSKVQGVAVVLMNLIFIFGLIWTKNPKLE